MSDSNGTFYLTAPKAPPALVFDNDNINNSNVKNKTDVVIVGAGPAGLLTACLLKKSGRTRDIKVFDMRERPTSSHCSAEAHTHLLPSPRESAVACRRRSRQSPCEINDLMISKAALVGEVSLSHLDSDV